MSSLLLFLFLTSHALPVALSAFDAPECPGGCIIASVVQPRRVCSCVQPSTCISRRLAITNGVAAAAWGGGFKALSNLLSLASLGGDRCNLCDEKAFTYRSFDECYDADTAFKGNSSGLNQALYPVIGLNITIAAVPKPGEEMLPGTTVSSCPPPVPKGCPTDAGATPWERMFPAAGPSSDLVVPAGQSVLLHGCRQPASTVSVRSIRVEPGATLVVGDSPLQLNFRHMIVNGTFRMGSPGCPINSRITVTVPGEDETNGIDVGGDGASYDVHGLQRGPTWTRVSNTVRASTDNSPSRNINLVRAVQWERGDKIVLVTTSWKDMLNNQNEVLTVESVTNNGRTVRVREPIRFTHYGGEYKAEVALLSRRISFSSDATSRATNIGPHTTFTSPNARVVGAAFERWGARNKRGRYPLHFHLAGEAPAAYLRNNAIYNSNWRCVSVHGTNAVTLSGNVGFNIPGHCYYLEDGVEERNVLEGNLAAYVVPINTAGSGGGQQGTDRWQSSELFDPSDAGAAGFYALNAHNSWINNAASGGFAGFTFPNAPRAIKDFRGAKRPDGTPFVPSERPMIAFRGNSVHSTGYQWQHGGCVYFGGVLAYRRDPSDNAIKLWYNNGRGSFQIEPLCPDPEWPADKEGANSHCYLNSARETKNAAGTAEASIVMQNTTTALCNVGIMSWGARAEVRGFAAYDVTVGAAFLGQAWMDSALIKVNTSNSRTGASGWPWTSRATWWEAWPIKGFEWYDTMTTTLLSNVTLDGYRRGSPYTDSPGGYWEQQAPSAFRMLSHSDQFKPDKTMMATKGIRCRNCDLGCTGTGPDRRCAPGALFRLDSTDRGGSWFFNWLDQDGSMVRMVQPSRPARPYLIGSSLPWWQLDGKDSWQEPAFGNAWISPMPAQEAVGRLDMRVETADGTRYTVGSFDGENTQQMGWVSHWGNVSRAVPLSRTEGTTGITGRTGWYTVFNTTQHGLAAPKRLELIVFGMPRNKAVLWASCWPQGTRLQVSRTHRWNACLNQPTLPAAPSRAALIGGNGGTMWVDPATNCLHLKVMDHGPSHAPNSKVYSKAGMSIEETVRWYDYKYTITAEGMSCSDPHFCSLPGDPASRVPPPVRQPVNTCTDKRPSSGEICPAVACGHALGGCNSATVIGRGLCQASCNRCRAPSS